MANTVEFTQQENSILTASSRKVISPNTIARGGGVAILALMLGAILQYGYNLGLARSFGPSKTGQFIFALSLISIAAIVGQFGAQELLLRYVASYRGLQNETHLRGVLKLGFTLGIVGSLLMTALILACSPLIAEFAHKPEMAATLRDLAWLTPLFAIANIMAAALQGAKRMGKAVVIREIGRPLAILAALFVSLLLSNSFASFITMNIGMAVLMACIGLFWLRGEFLAIGLRGISVYRLTEWLSFSFSVMLMDIFRSTSGWLDTLVLGFFVPVEDIAIYFAAVRTALLSTLVLAGFNAILAPLSADLWHQRDLRQLETVYRITTRWTCTLILPITVATILVRYELMAIFGDDYTKAGAILLIMILGRTVNGLTGGVGRMLVMTGHERVELINTIITTAAMIIGMAWAATHYGMTGVAVVSSVLIVLANITKLLQVYWFTGLQPYHPSYFKLIPATIISTLIGMFCYYQLQTFPHLVILVIVPSIVFVSYSVMIVLLGIEPEDKNILKWS